MLFDCFEEKFLYPLECRRSPRVHEVNPGRDPSFNGKTEYGLAPIELSGDDILRQLENLNDVNFGKHPSSKKRNRSPNELNWTKKSIFFICLIGID